MKKNISKTGLIVLVFLLTFIVGIFIGNSIFYPRKSGEKDNLNLALPVATKTYDIDKSEVVIGESDINNDGDSESVYPDLEDSGPTPDLNDPTLFDQSIPRDERLELFEFTDDEGLPDLNNPILFDQSIPRDERLNFVQSSDDSDLDPDSNNELLFITE